MYGTATYGGPTEGCDSLGCGLVFRMQPPAAGKKQWTYTALHFFHASDGLGQYPMGGVVMDASGNLYGATYTSGANGHGILYKLTATTGSGFWPLTKLHDFSASLQEHSTAPLTLDGGFLYSTTGDSSGSFGTVFRYGP